MRLDRDGIEQNVSGREPNELVSALTKDDQMYVFGLYYISNEGELR